MDTILAPHPSYYSMEWPRSMEHSEMASLKTKVLIQPKYTEVIWVVDAIDKHYPAVDLWRVTYSFSDISGLAGHKIVAWWVIWPARKSDVERALHAGWRPGESPREPFSLKTYYHGHWVLSPGKNVHGLAWNFVEQGHGPIHPTLRSLGVLSNPARHAMVLSFLRGPRSDLSPMESVVAVAPALWRCLKIGEGADVFIVMFTPPCSEEPEVVQWWFTPRCYGTFKQSPEAWVYHGTWLSNWATGRLTLAKHLMAADPAITAEGIRLTVDTCRMFREVYPERQILIDEFLQYTVQDF